MKQVTQLLDAINTGRAQAASELLSLVYEELRRVAANKMANEQPGQTLQPTALVHEAWIKLVGSDRQSWRDRGHFFGAAAEAMRRILIDRARKRNRARHGHGLQRVDLSQVTIATEASDDQLLAVDEALRALEGVTPQHAKIVQLRYYVGLSIPEIAAALVTSESTVKRQWNYARLWLFRRLNARLEED